MPALLAPAARCFRIDDRERAVEALGADKRRVGLLVVPGVCVALPGDAVEMEDLRLKPASALRIAAFHLQRERLDQDAVLREEDLAAVVGPGRLAVVDLDGARARHGDKAVGARM